MSTHSPQNPSRPLWQKILFALVIVIVLSVAGYWGNKTVQTHLGQSALGATGLDVMSLSDALKAANINNKYVLADMSAIWCPTCRSLDKEVFATDIVRAEIEKDFVFARIEYESLEGQAFRKAYEVEGFPTLLILDENAKKLVQLPLVFEPEAFITNLQKVTKALN